MSKQEDKQSSEALIAQIKEGKLSCVVIQRPFEEPESLEIFRALKNSTNVTGVTYQFYGSNYEFTDKAAEGFSGLMNHKTIKTLSFQGGNFAFSTFTTFCKQAELGINLRFLGFYEVNFESNGVGLIAKILEKNHPLKSLSVSYCNLTSGDIALISEGLRNNTTLKYLSFAGSKVQEIDNLVKVLTPDGTTSSNTSLNFLKLSNMGLGKNEAEKIADMLKSSKSLRQLDLSGNYFINASVLKIFEAVAVNKSLQELLLQNLTEWSFFDNDKATIQSYVKANKTLTKITCDKQLDVDSILQFHEQCIAMVRQYFAGKPSLGFYDVVQDCMKGNVPFVDYTIGEIGAVLCLEEDASDF